MDSLMNLGGEDCETPVCKEAYVDTLIGNLQRKQERAQRELNAATAALNALKANPEVANILELISKAR